MKNILGSIRAIAVFAILSMPCVFPAQSLCQDTALGGQQGNGADHSAVAVPEDQESSTLPQTSFESSDVVPALNGAGLIVIDSANKPLLSFGYEADLGWDSSSKGGSSGLATAAPYVAIQSRLGHSQFIIQYNPLFAKYTAASRGEENLQRASVRLIGSFNPRWSWNASGTFAYGQDSIRLLAPTESVPVGEVPGIGPNAAVYSPNAGVGTFLNAGLGLRYLKSVRDSVSIQLGDSYSRFSGIVGDTSVQSARIGYDHKVSPTFSFSPYSQLLTSTGSVSCVSIGGGAGIEWQLAQRTGISLSAGPQFSSRQCGTQQSYLFNAALNTQLNDSSQLYVVAGRQFSSPYLGPGFWQNSVGVGYQRIIKQAASATFDVSYAGSAGTGSGSDYQGIFLGGSFGKTLGKAFNSSLTYRRIISRTGSSNLNRDTIVFSINWNSSPVPILRQNRIASR